LIRIKDRNLLLPLNASKSFAGEVTMPFDAMLVSAAVVAMFAVFAGVVLWGDLQTRPDRSKVNSAASKAPQSPERATGSVRKAA
jgi:hypothetical protein